MKLNNTIKFDVFHITMIQICRNMYLTVELFNFASSFHMVVDAYMRELTQTYRRFSCIDKNVLNWQYKIYL